MPLSHGTHLLFYWSACTKSTNFNPTNRD
uniref:Putative thimet oligopeptidase isoform X2 n=1 Tax=Rhizophora mucronata TaxID=61149 RepID=A0A2P2KF76_RHIMU